MIVELLDYKAYLKYVKNILQRQKSGVEIKDFSIDNKNLHKLFKEKLFMTLLAIRMSINDNSGYNAIRDTIISGIDALIDENKNKNHTQKTSAQKLLELTFNKHNI